ncbi:MAG: cytidine deaminase [Candidatus Azotimanducaceae bacterium]
MKEDSRVALAIQHATEARKLAYAPYSKFRMGASVITDQGEIIRGTLVENVSLGLAMCAERSALFASVANAEGTPAVLALASPKTSGGLTWPCGACLQVALELGGSDLLVAVSDGKTTEAKLLGELAPNMPKKF